MVQKYILCALIVPLALLLGFLAANPNDRLNLLFFGGVFAVLLFPLLIRWHHLMAIVSVNLFVNAFFLPGQPPLWVPLAFMSMLISYTAWLIDRRGSPIHYENRLALPLILLGIVVLLTASATGGISGQALGGSQWGGKRYLYVFGAIAAYFAISMKLLPQKKERMVFLWFVLVGGMAIIGNLIVLAGPGFYFLFNLFPYEFSTLLEGQSFSGLVRYTGFSVAAQFGILGMLAAYGLRGIFTGLRPGRILLFLMLLVVGLLGGFRSFLIKLVVICAIQFMLEGMFRPRYLFAVVLVGLLLLVGMIGFASRLPLSMQRALTIVPFVQVDASAEQDAWGTLDWRFQIWKIVIPEVPRYLIVGKGYSFDGTDAMLTQMSYQRGIIHSSFEETLITGNYHNGILTLIVPFGIWGMVLFSWFLGAAFFKLYHYYRFGPSRLKTINTFILAWFCQLVIHYLVFYGQFDLDLIKFTSLVALAVSINARWAGSLSPLSLPTGLPELGRSSSSSREVSR